MLNRFSRRTLARMLAGSAAVLSWPRTGLAAEGVAAASSGNRATERTFPDGFLWGVGTASYQVEGAVHEAGL